MRALILFFVAGITTMLAAQSIPYLPISAGAGTAEAWNDSLYFFGGANTWGGRDRLYNVIYKFDGLNWSYLDSIPDNNVWDIQSVLVGNEVFLLAGWRSGAAMLRKYNLSERTWTYLRSSPNRAAWGSTVEYVNGIIYLFDNQVNVFAYDIAGDTWSTKTPNASRAYPGLRSVVWHDEIYMVGFYDNDFYKYSPAHDTWTQLADTPYSIAACAMGLLNDHIYCMAGSETGNNANTYQKVLAYDSGTNAWTVDQIQIDGRRTWMATATYRSEFYIIGGFDSLGVAVDVVERIVPRGPATRVAALSAVLNPANFSLHQNYPNPFNPATTIPYALAQPGAVEVTIHDMLGRRVRTLVRSWQAAGNHVVVWDGLDDAGRAVAGGTYFCRLQAGKFAQQRQLALVK